MTKEEIKTRVQKLMASMTVEEKALQLTCMMPPDLSHPENLGIEKGVGAMPISLGATFDPALVQEMAAINQRQMRAVGIRHALSPVG